MGQETGPCLLASTAPLYMLELAIKRTSKRVPKELWSRDAGTFFCNEIYYRTLFSVRARDIGPRGQLVDAQTWTHSLMPVVFIHVPPAKIAPIDESADFVQRVASVIARQSLE